MMTPDHKMTRFFSSIEGVVDMDDSGEALNELLQGGFSSTRSGTTYPETQQASASSSGLGSFAPETTSMQEAKLHYLQGNQLLFQGQLREAETYFDQAFQAFQQDKSKGAFSALCLLEMGWIRYQLEKNDGGAYKAQYFFDEAKQLIKLQYGAPGMLEVYARYLHYSGLVYFYKGDYSEAVARYKKGLSICNPQGLEAAKLLDSLARYYDRIGDFHHALTLLHRALSVKENLFISQEEIATLRHMGRIQMHLEDFAGAEVAFKRAIRLSDQLHDKKQSRQLSTYLTLLSIRQGHLGEAQQKIDTLIHQVSAIEDPETVGLCKLYMAYIHYKSREYSDCETLLRHEVIHLLKRVPEKVNYGIAVRMLGGVLFAQKNFYEALESMSEAISIFQDEHAIEELVKTHLEMGKVYAGIPDHSLALASYLEGLRVAEAYHLNFLARYIEEELYQLDLDTWKQVIQRRATNQIFNISSEKLLLGEDASLDEAPVQDRDTYVTSLMSLLKMGQAMAGEQDISKLLALITDETATALNAERCTVFLLDRDTNELWSKVGIGIEEQELRFPAYKGIAGYVVKTGETLNIEDAYNDPRFNPSIDKRTGYKTNNLLCMAIRNRKMETIGVFQVLNKQGGVFTAEDEELMTTISSLAGVTLENALLVNTQKLAFESFIHTLASTIDARDPITAGHSRRVADYSMLVGEQLTLPKDDMEALNYASLLHDIGKIGIREDILLKDGRLTEHEYKHIQKHAYYTYEILKNIRFDRHLSNVPEIAASHHEKFDGTGYFRGLRGVEIPFLGRIVAISDVFDAVTSRRHYRNRMPFDRVLGIFRRDCGKHFDPDCIESFFNIPLASLTRILLFERGEYYESAQMRQLLNQLGSAASIRDYEDIFKKESRSHGEEAIIDIFHQLYFIGPTSDLS
ncbi:MAG: HD domain-containing phosphohydrolase [Vampirovibrionales bacterium]